MNLRKFGLALLFKSLWKTVFGNSIWSNAIRIKYVGSKISLFGSGTVHLGLLVDLLYGQVFIRFRGSFSKTLYGNFSFEIEFLLVSTLSWAKKKFHIFLISSYSCSNKNVSFIGHRLLTNCRVLFQFGNLLMIWA